MNSGLQGHSCDKGQVIDGDGLKVGPSSYTLTSGDNGLIRHKLPLEMIKCLDCELLCGVGRSSKDSLMVLHMGNKSVLNSVNEMLWGNPDIY